MAERDSVQDARGGRRWLRVLLAAGLGCLLAFGGCVAWLVSGFLKVTSDLTTYREDPLRLDVDHRKTFYSHQGIVLDVHCPAGVTEV